jgi:hypothetical protein
MNQFEQLGALKPRSAARPRDVLLLTFVATVESSSALSGVGITLNLDGTVLSGRLVSRADWFERMAAGREEDDLAGQFVRSVSEEMDRLDREAGEGESDEDPEFLHLVDARLVSGDTTVGVGHWRCRVSDVSAWSLYPLGHGAS